MRLFFFFLITACAVAANVSADQTKLEATLGIDKVPYENMAIRIKPKGRCMFGDMEAIALDLGHDPTADLLLTVEPLTASGKGVVHSLKNVSLAPGSSHQVSLNVPRSTKPQVFGVYICKDSNKAGKCRGKGVQDIGAAIEVYDAKKTLPAGFKPSDKVYYFDLLIVEPTGLKIMTKLINEDQYILLGEYLAGILGSDEVAESVTETIQGNQMTIQSLPLARGFAGGLEIYLPYLDQRRCFGG